MFRISYLFLVFLISFLWLMIRAVINLRQKNIHWKRELELLLAYVCIIVVVRFTFFPFESLAPLVFDPSRILPLNLNLIPLINLFDYPDTKAIILNVAGNIAMFIPLGIIWPYVFKKLYTPFKVISSGVLFSLCIEVLQLPFRSRVTDVDDLILNSLGYVIGYGIFAAVKAIKNKLNNKKLS